MSSPLTKKRIRLQPEVRRNMILDHAGQMVAESGVSAVNMDKLARLAGVSKPLIYLYFPNRAALLRTLLEREMTRNQEENAQAVALNSSIEDMVRATSRVMLANVAEKGVILQRLLGEPEIADYVLELTAKIRNRQNKWLTTRMQTEFGIPPEMSRLMVELALGMSAAAGQVRAQTDTDPALIEDLLVKMILGAIDNVSSAYSELTVPPAV